MISLQLPSVVEVYPKLRPPSLVSCWPGCQYHDHRLSSLRIMVFAILLLIFLCCWLNIHYNLVKGGSIRKEREKAFMMPACMILNRGL